MLVLFEYNFENNSSFRHNSRLTYPQIHQNCSLWVGSEFSLLDRLPQNFFKLKCIKVNIKLARNKNYGDFSIFLALQCCYCDFLV